MSTTDFLRSFLKFPSLPQDADPATKNKIIADKVRHWYVLYRHPELACESTPTAFELRHYRRNARQNLRRLFNKYPVIVETVLRDSEVQG